MSTDTITSREDLLALLAAVEDYEWELPPHAVHDAGQHDLYVKRGEHLRQRARDAVEAAATGPAEHAATITAKQLAAQAPALPPLKLPKPSARDLNGATVKKVLAGKRTAAIVHTINGVRVVDAIDLDDPDVIVIATRNEVRDLVTVKGKSPVDVARDILDVELKSIAKAAA